MERTPITGMPCMQHAEYIAPAVEIAEINVEQGFAISVPGTLPGFGDGGTW